ncbi:VWA domain-containing protein [Peptococcus simiae]|uniref:DUF7604 domain-containing protein n=1 Tax=Peptococcus simiae TaxID=1643805 RepID=UPI003980DA10
MKNKISKLINIFLVIIMLFPHSSGVFASGYKQNSLENLSMPSIIQQNIVNDSQQNTDSNLDTSIKDRQNEDTIEAEKIEQNHNDVQRPEETKQNLVENKIGLSEEDNKLIEKYRLVIKDEDIDYPQLSTQTDAIESNKGKVLSDIKIVKTAEDTNYTELTINEIENKNNYFLLSLKSQDNKAINSLILSNRRNIEIVRDLFTKTQKERIKRILIEIDTYRKDSEKIQELLGELRNIKPYYSLEDEQLTVKQEIFHEENNRDEILLENKNPDKFNINLIIRVKDENLLEDEDLLNLLVEGENEEDSYSLRYLKEIEEYRSAKPILYANNIKVQDTETIASDDIGPPNYLNLLANMPGASATVEAGPGVNGNIWGYQKDVVDLSANTQADSGALWGGDWSKASTTIFTKLAGNTATAVRFKPSDTSSRNYRNKMDAGWDDRDLNLDTTSMWVKVKYTNAAYYKNEIVDAEATIKVTPMKNRNENSYADHNYGSSPYYPMLQISHNLYKGWCWQNVKEINVDLVFKRKNGDTIRFESSTFGQNNATYFTINSLNEETEHRDGNLQYGSVHSLGPEYVRVQEGTITGAYVIPGSHIETSYKGGRSSGTQYAYNGGKTQWDGDDPSYPNWSQNSVLFTTANTDHLNFTMGNLMRDPESGYVPRTNFVWTSMSTQSFANYYVNYKDIEVNKSWSDDDDSHNPITINLFKNFKVKIKWGNFWNQNTREIEIKNLLLDTITLSGSNHWKGGFYRIPDEESQNKLIKRRYKKNINELILEAGQNFPQGIPDDFEIESVSDFKYTISEVKVPGYTTKIEKSTDTNPETDINKDIYHITNTKEGYVPDPPNPLKPKVKVNKQIDYLGDGIINNDTNVQKDDKYKNQLEDIYRLYLDVEGERLKKQEPVDLLFVLDGSSSMRREDMSRINGWGNTSRKEAMIEMINQTDLVPNFLNQNPENRVAFLYFDGNTRNRNTNKWQGYSYKNDAHNIKGWSHRFAKNIDFNLDVNYMGTNYQAGLMLAEDYLKESENIKGRRQAMIFISDGVPTFWIDSDGNRRETGNYNNPTTVENSKWHTKTFIDGFFKRHPNLTTHAVGVSRDITEENQSASQSPEVLQYMANKGNGSYIGVKSNTGELVEKLRHAIEAAVTEVRIEDTLSDRVELLAEKADYKVVKINKETGQQTLLWENGQGTWQNGSGDSQQIKSLSYDANNKKVILTFNPSYKLEENTKYILSYNIRTNQKAKDDYLKEGYDFKGDKNTDYKNNATSSEMPGFRSNKIAEVYYNGGKKEYPHPVVQVKEIPGYELPTTGGTGVTLIKVIGTSIIIIVGFILVRKKKK